jgi:hypothetical protein
MGYFSRCFFSFLLLWALLLLLLPLPLLLPLMPSAVMEEEEEGAVAVSPSSDKRAGETLLAHPLPVTATMAQEESHHLLFLPFDSPVPPPGGTGAFAPPPPPPPLLGHCHIAKQLVVVILPDKEPLDRPLHLPAALLPIAVGAVTVVGIKQQRLAILV